MPSASAVTNIRFYLQAYRLYHPYHNQRIFILFYLTAMFCYPFYFLLTKLT